jgi:hypothetical protein
MKGFGNESQSICEKDVQQMQDYSTKRHRSGHLREQKAQAKTRIRRCEIGQNRRR